MSKRILITGGAGFIGSHLTRHLLSLGHEITILDSFLPQVHVGGTFLSSDLAHEVRLISGDVADPAKLGLALEGQQCVVHYAAETGTGQSMYEVARYERTNVAGTALLYDLLAKTNNKIRTLERVVVASSRAIYGEGAYQCELDGLVYPKPRSVDDKRAGSFDPLCPICGGACTTVPTPEAAPYQPASFYGLTKQVQEQMALLFGGALRIPTVALRYQNVYGPGQSLQNPYTGILAIFSNLARTGRTIQVFEDGEESRDFVYIDDVVRATAACISDDIQECHVVNVGSGERTTVLDVAQQINDYFGRRSELKTTGAFREGDIRHGMADLSLARQVLRYESQWKFKDGLQSFLECASQSAPSESGYERSLEEMKSRGLLRESGSLATGREL
jgi:dTDP-L-rhamnose 4-epimerase